MSKSLAERLQEKLEGQTAEIAALTDSELKKLSAHVQSSVTGDPLCAFLGIPPVEGEINREAVNVGPSSTMNAEVTAIFEEVFAPLRDRHAALLEQHRDIVIG